MPDLGIRPWLLRLPMAPRVRGWVMRAFGASIGSNVRVHPVVVMNAHWGHLVIEDDCYLGPSVVLDLADSLRIRRGSVLAAGAMVFTHQDAGASHGSPTAARVRTFHRPTSIGPNGFLGAGAIVLAGANIGSDSVVAAGAVVTRPVADGVTFMGR